MTKSMETVLARFEAWLRANRTGYVDQLLPPVAPDVLADATRLANVKDLGSLVKLYAWRGGNPEGSSKGFWHNFEFYNVDAIRETLQAQIENRDAGEFPSAVWHGWVPFLSSGRGHVCVDYLGAFDGVPGQIVETWNDDLENPIVLAPSLEDWLDVFVTGLERDLWDGAKGDLQPREPEDNVKKLHEQMLPGYPRDIAL